MELFSFWLFASLLTVAAILSALWPIFRTSEDDKAREGDETQLATRQVLIDQLDEIKNDKERGFLNEEEAEAARTEIARRLLSVDREIKSQKKAKQAGSIKAYVILMVLLIPITSIALYALIGVYGAKDQPYAARQAEIQQAQAEKGPSIDDLVARVEAHLENKPDDGRGWQTLAPIYQRQGKLDKAETAFKNAIRIGAKDESIIGRMHNGLGQILAMKAEGSVTEEARLNFQKGKEKAPNDPTGFFFEALALSQLEKREEAILAWEDVIARFGSQNPPWIDVAQNTLATLKQEIGQAESPKSPENLENQAKGPSSDDIKAAEALSDEDRSELIRGMVAGLAERLDENPDDFPGWQRLIRSYMVLGEKQKAIEAVQKARVQFSQDDEKVQSLDKIEKSLNF